MWGKTKKTKERSRRRNIGWSKNRNRQTSDENGSVRSASVQLCSKSWVPKMGSTVPGYNLLCRTTVSRTLMPHSSMMYRMTSLVCRTQQTVGHLFLVTPICHQQCTIQPRSLCWRMCRSVCDYWMKSTPVWPSVESWKKWCRNNQLFLLAKLSQFTPSVITPAT